MGLDSDGVSKRGAISGDERSRPLNAWEEEVRTRAFPVGDSAVRRGHSCAGVDTQSAISLAPFKKLREEYGILTNIELLRPLITRIKNVIRCDECRTEYLKMSHIIV